MFNKGDESPLAINLYQGVHIYLGSTLKFWKTMKNVLNQLD